MYVHLTVAHHVEYWGTPPDSFDLADLPGRAWLLKAEENGKARLLPADGTRVLEVTNLYMIGRRPVIGDRSVSLEESPVVGAEGRSACNRDIIRCKPADAREDYGVVTNRLANQATPDQSGLTLQGRYMILAANLYRAGFKTEANTLAGMLLKSKSAKTVLAIAMDRMADTQYETACDLLFKTRNWQEYRRSLDLLLSRFDATWRRRGAVAALAAQVKDRVAHPLPPPIQGAGITDEDKALASAMANEMLDPDRPLASTLWILPQSDVAGDSVNAPGSSFSRILQRGMKSIPLLIALTNDNYLVPVDAPLLSRQDSYIAEWLYIRATGRRMDENGLCRRPVTRGELASLFLRLLVLPEVPLQNAGYGSSRSSDGVWHVDEGSWQSESEWYEQNAGKAPSDLALNYVAKGNCRQSDEARMWLVRNGTERDTGKLEKWLLNLVPSSDSMQFVGDYVTVQGPKAVRFVREYETALTNRASLFRSNLSDDPEYSRVKDAVQSLRHLRLVTRTAEQLLAEFEAGTNGPGELRWPLECALSREEPNRQLSLVLAAAVATTNVKTRLQLLGNLGTWRWRPAANRHRAGGANPREYADLWRTLLADFRPTSAGGDDLDESVADVVAGVIDTVYGAPGESFHEPCEGRADSRIRDLKRRRALDRVDGKTGDQLPAYPCSENVTQERRERLVDDIMKAPATGLVARIASLSMSEILALGEDAGNNADLGHRLQPMAYRVAKVEIGRDCPAECGRLGEFEGKVLDRRILETVAGICRKVAAANGKLFIVAVRRPGLEGVRLAAFDPGNEEDVWRWAMCKGHRRDSRAYAAMVSLFWTPMSAPAEWNWPVGEKAEGAKAEDSIPADPPVDEERDESQYWDDLGKSLAEGTDIFRGGHIVAVAFPKSAEGEEDGSQ